jgi:hypothetical protein
LSRRVSLPAADDLFRPTGDAAETQPRPSPVRAVEESQPEPQKPKNRQSSGRVRHDEKMTVYVTSAELHDLEHARLVLRSTHGLAVDRGRLVREALAVVLADFEARGADSVIVRRLNRG